MLKIVEYSGHIRNGAELCKKLNIDEHLPRSERENAIIKAGYELWHEKLPNYLYGSFAVVLYDEERDVLFLVRDHFGTKPLYYFEKEDGKVIASTQIRTLLNQEGVKKEFNEALLQIYLTMTYTTGEDTFFKGIKKLLPGRFMTVKSGKKEIVRYWKPEFKPSRETTLEEWTEKLHETVKLVMSQTKDENERADSFLSGGVDSSYVLAMSGADACGCCGYEDKRLDESCLAEETAKFLGKPFNRCLVEPEDYFKAVPYVMYNMEQPLGDASAVAFAIGCIAESKRTKICYSGEGADEFFGGYNIYRNAEKYGDNLKNFYIGNTNIMKEEEKQKILKHYDPSFLPINLLRDIYAENEGLDPLSKMMDVDIQVWLEGDIYLNVDKMSRAAGLEVRMPLTDVRIFDIASEIPSELKINEEQNKLVLRCAAAKVLPQETAFRKKLGFVVPIRMWLADDRYNGDVRRLFNSDIAEKFFNTNEIHAIFEDYKNGNSDNWRKIWTIYTFLVWYEQYFVLR